METPERPDDIAGAGTANERAILRQKIANAFRGQAIESLVCQRIVETLAQAYEAWEAHGDE